MYSKTSYGSEVVEAMKIWLGRTVSKIILSSHQLYFRKIPKVLQEKAQKSRKNFWTTVPTPEWFCRLSYVLTLN